MLEQCLAQSRCSVRGVCESEEKDPLTLLSGPCRWRWWRRPPTASPVRSAPPPAWAGGQHSQGAEGSRRVGLSLLG